MSNLAIHGCKPIAYRLPNSDLITSLAYTNRNGELSATEKNIVNYMIKSEENLMKSSSNIDVEKTYEDWMPKIPDTPFVSSDSF